MAFSGRIVKHFGTHLCISITLFAWGVRFLGYSFAKSMWAILPFDLIDAVCFGLGFTTLCTFASKSALPGTQATMQVNAV